MRSYINSIVISFSVLAASASLAAAQDAQSSQNTIVVGSTTAHASQNRLAMTNIRKMLLTFAITLIGLAGVALVYLIYPGIPSKSQVMAFEGFIELPRGGLLTVLDYLTVNNQTLFVTSESSAALFKIALDPRDLKATTE